MDATQVASPASQGLAWLRPVGQGLVAIGGLVTFMTAVVPGILVALVFVGVSTDGPAVGEFHIDRGEALGLAIPVVLVLLVATAVVALAVRGVRIASVITGLVGLLLAWTGGRMAATAAYVDVYLLYAVVLAGAGLALLGGVLLMALGRRSAGARGLAA